MAERAEHFLAPSGSRRASRAEGPLPWPGVRPPGESERDLSRDRPPTLVFAAGLAVWGLGLLLVLGRCAPVG